MDALLKNIRYAGRRLAQTPGFTSVAILSLALGIGANTAIFSLVNAVLIREVPLERPEELVEVYLSSPDFEYGVFSWPDYEDFKEGTTEVFSEVSGTRLLIVQFDNAEGVEMVPGEAVTGNYFRTLGIEAELGRLLLPEDDIAPGGHAVVVLGHGYWQNAYGGDPGVVGQSLRIGGLAYTIVGVAPEAYSGHFRGIVPTVFAPRMMINQLMPGADDELQARGSHSVFVKARKRPGVSLVQAETAASAVAARLRDDDVQYWDSQASFLFVPTTDVILFPPADTFIKATAWILTGVVGLVLLLACINLASFLLARALDRKKEIALRLALGATRRHLIGQLLTETTMLALLGGGAGVAVSVGLLRILVSADLPLPLPITLDLSPDLNVLGFSLAVSVLAGLFLALPRRSRARTWTCPRRSRTRAQVWAGAASSPCAIFLWWPKSPRPSCSWSERASSYAACSAYRPSTPVSAVIRRRSSRSSCPRRAIPRMRVVCSPSVCSRGFASSPASKPWA